MKKVIYSSLFLFLFLTGLSQSLYFPPTTGDQWDTITPQSLLWCPSEIDSLYAFLDQNNTKSFIVLKDGKIVLEKYFGTHNSSSLWYWASAGKTLTAFLVGIAQQEGALSISDTTSQYLGEGWTSAPLDKEKKITIWHQLSMTSGLDDGVVDSHCTLDTCLVYEADAGTRWAYHNAPYTLLDGVINSATGSTLNLYATQKLKNPIGMNGAFITSDYNNVYYSNARSMARFGLLMLNKGKWDQTPILTDTTYFNEMVTTSQNLNLSYGYLWWLNGKSSFMIPQSQFVFPGFLSPNAPPDMYAAMGKNGQFINVIPSLNMVWIRMGDSPDNTDVSFLLNDQIWVYINRLPCESSTPEYTEKPKFFPNPTSGTIQFASEYETVIIYDLTGKLIQKFTNVTEIDLSNLISGIYILNLYDHQNIYNYKIVKE